MITADEGLTKANNASIDSDAQLQEKVDALKTKKEKSKAQDILKEELKAINNDLTTGKARLKDESTPTMRHLFDLIK